MTAPTNILTQVQLFLRASLEYMGNSNCVVKNANMKFKDFQNFVGNLGSTTTFDLPTRFTTTNGLVASFQPATQRPQTLVCDQAANTSYTFTAQERIFNVDKDVESYMKEFGKGATMELSSAVEINVAQNFHSGTPVNQIINSQTVPTGALHTESGPYRFFGNGVTPINSFQQLQQAITNFKNYGAVKEGIKVFLPDVIIPSIIGTGLNQFAPKRNDDIANSWELGEFGTPPVKYFVSNLLPTHISGNVGNSNVNGVTTAGANILTVISTNDPTGNNITQITCSGGTASDANAIFSGDLGVFNDGVSGQPNMRYLTFIGHNVSYQPVQIRMTANAGASSGGNIVLNVLPALQSTPGATQNINNNIAAGMTITIQPSHVAGCIIGADAMYVSMPRLPDNAPFPTANEADMDTGVSLRMTYGSTFGANQQGMVHDCTWGSTIVPEDCMRFLFPLTQFN